MLPKTRSQATHTQATMRFRRMVAFVFLACFLFFGSALLAHAQQDDFGVVGVGENINIPANPNADLRVLVVRIINFFLGFLGLVAVSIVLYAGYLWMTSRGNEEQISSAKKMLINGVIGLAIIMSAFVITSFILRSLTGQETYTPPSASSPPPVQTYAFSGALGRSVKDHYPLRNQLNVARNTSIVVTFGLPINPLSIIENSNRTCWDANFMGPTTTCVDLTDVPVTSATPVEEIARPYLGDCADLNRDGILDTKTAECDQLKTSAVTIDTESNFTSSTVDTLGVSSAALATYTSERNVFSFVFKPHQYLGSSTEDVQYRVRLNTSIVRSDQNQSIFSNGVPYTWNFTTGNFIDVDPPTVVDVYPRASATTSRNTILQITFSEPIDPTVAESVITATTLSTFTPVNQVFAENRVSPPGSWRLSNGYRTLEFVSGEACGVNSCGEQMFCLPVSCQGPACTNPYEVLLRTGVSTNNSDAPFEAVPFSGIYDLAFNGLDNVSNNAATNRLVRPDPQTSVIIRNTEKAPDNYSWGFLVENTIDRSVPYVQEITPGAAAEDISSDAPMYIKFSKRMIAHSVSGYGSSSGIALEEYPAGVCADAAIDSDGDGTNVCADEKKLPPIAYWINSEFGGDTTLTRISHRDFGPNNLDLYYLPSIPSTVKSVNQNCLYPGRGPSANILTTPETPSTCTAVFDAEGNYVEGVGCAEVSSDDPEMDTACVYDPGASEQSSSNIAECLNMLRTRDRSPSSY